MKLSVKKGLVMAVFLLGICSVFPNLDNVKLEDESTVSPKDYRNENISIVVEICDMVAYLVLLGIYEYKTKSYPWTVYRVLFRVLTGFKLFDDILHIIPCILTIQNGYPSGYVLSNFSLIVSSIIRGLLLFANIRYSKTFTLNYRIDVLGNEWGDDFYTIIALYVIAHNIIYILIIIFLKDYKGYTLYAYAMLDILFYVIFYVCAYKTKNRLMEKGHYSDANVIRCYRTGLTWTLLIGFICYGAYTPYFIELQKIEPHLHWMFVLFFSMSCRFDLLLWNIVQFSFAVQIIRAWIIHIRPHQLK